VSMVGAKRSPEHLPRAIVSCWPINPGQWGIGYRLSLSAHQPTMKPVTKAKAISTHQASQVMRHPLGRPGL
jgi:hypothetical protein